MARRHRDQPHDEQLSKELSNLLRYNAVQKGIAVSHHGYVAISDAARYLRRTEDEIHQVAEKSEKHGRQRFHVDPDGNRIQSTSKCQMLSDPPPPPAAPPDRRSPSSAQPPSRPAESDRYSVSSRANDGSQASTSSGPDYVASRGLQAPTLGYSSAGRAAPPGPGPVVSTSPQPSAPPPLDGERDAHLIRLREDVAQRDQTIAQRDQTIAQQDQTISGQRRRIDQLEQELERCKQAQDVASAQPLQSSSTSSTSCATPSDMLTVKGAFNGTEYGDEYLIVNVGDVVQKIVHDASDDNWAYVKIVHRGDGTPCGGAPGWVPSSFLESG